MGFSPEYQVQLDTLTSGFDGVTCWVQARGGAIPGDPPAVVVTMQKLLLSQSDVFFGLNEMRTDDSGATWTGPAPQDGLTRRAEPDGVEAVLCDATPKWHARTARLLSTGHVARYRGDTLADEPCRRETAYTVYDDRTRTWSAWQGMPMPEAEGKFFSAGAGSAQRVDEPDGTILLPVYFKGRDNTDGVYATTVVRAAFDGRVLRYLEHGDELAVPAPRGLCEPSLTKLAGRYYMTLRNDEKGYVTSGSDALRFDPPRVWCFDDGQELGNYNTQQHWVTHSEGLFLVYTRRGLNNDHIFRHRAPLVMAKVDTDRLCVLRSTERVLVPQRGARLGNFAIAEVSPAETWVIVAEWMQNGAIGPDNRDICTRYGSDNSVFAARILWDVPNRGFLP